MKRGKKLYVIMMSLCTAIGLSVSSAKAVEVYALVEENNAVKVYKNMGTEKMYADLDLSKLEYASEITIYHDEIQDIDIRIDIQNSISDKSLYSQQTTDWSSGMLPDGLSTLRPHIRSGGLEASFYADVKGNYPARIIKVYTPMFKREHATVNSLDLNIITELSEKYLPAAASMTFNYTVKKFGFVLGSHVGYLTLEVNTNGQIRLTWG